MFGLKGSFLWALKMMRKGHIVRPKCIDGTVKYRFSTDNRERIEWCFIRSSSDGFEITNGWSNACVFYNDVEKNEWEIWK